MIEVFRIPISKNRLRSMPAAERNLLLLISHAVNQISVIDAKRGRTNAVRPPGFYKRLARTGGDFLRKYRRSC